VSSVYTITESALEATIVYLASAASDYMNGQALALDGGFLSW
jgi:NAD(P)-dependent dehydrogenase (short-subunit alcohol dehydrogenase family)